MRFNVPQFIDVQDKIVGPLTLKQFMLLLGAGLLLLIMWYALKLWAVAIVGIPLVVFLAAVIFIKINGRPFFSYIISVILYYANPRIYIWKKGK